jgi:predicted alpha-1,2-mannosidase
MKNTHLIILLLAILLSSCKLSNKPSKYVDPFIGTGGHGHTFPGATVPFGMVQLSPDTRIEGWDGCSGYHYSDTVIYGFSHTHLSGTGVGDYCDILFMPTVEKYYLESGYKADIKNGYASSFNKKTEKASPGFYAVELQDYNIKVELTATTRAGFHKYTFPKNKNAFVTLDLTHRDEVIESSFKQINEYEIEGMRRSKGWAQDQYIYFVAKFNQAIKTLILSNNDTIIDQKEAFSKNIKAAFDFGVLTDNNLLLKVGISAVDIEGARKNLDTEIADWDFKAIEKVTKESWNKELNKIQITSDHKNKTVFYSALYHTMIAPNTFMDIDKRYRGTDLEIHKAEDFTNYTIFSLWDTYRAAHPLYTIIDQKRTTDYIKTFINQYKNGGQLPVWELAGNYTGCMIGYHSIPVITDAYMKGIKDFDINTAYEAMKHSTMQDHLGLESYKKYGYVLAHKESESVSKTLEYAYDDWCIAQIAKSIDSTEDYNYYIKRAQSYKNIYDPTSGFMRAKLNGSWKFPFDPTEVDFHFTEANSWQYSFYAPQDISGLIQLMGGKEKFNEKLDQLFTADDKTTGRHQVDITGLIGQYAHGNEPSHHMAYLYNYVNKPWKTQKMVHRILNEMYTINPDGYSGNEDCGQMSAWYVLSAAGFYPVTPTSNLYIIGTPQHKETIFNLENGNTFTIKAKNLSEKNIYIQSAKLNGQDYTQSYINHNDIMEGGELIFYMGSKPNVNWGSEDQDIPVSEITDNLIIPTPYSSSKRRSFNKEIKIKLKHQFENTNIYYTTNGAEPTNQTNLYEHPLTIDKTTTIKYFAEKQGQKSFIAELNLIKFPKGKNIELISKPHQQYSGESDSSLIDGIFGGHDFRIGDWLGFYAKDMEAIIDFGKNKRVSNLSVNFIQDVNSWIFMPEYVEYYHSHDGKNYTLLGKVDTKTPEDEWGSIIEDYTLKINPVWTRYIKVIGKSGIMCPDWHKGKGNQLFIFADEITIK